MLVEVDSLSLSLLQRVVSQLVNTTVAPTAIDQKEESKSSMTVGIVITNGIFYPSDLVNAKTKSQGR